MIKRFNYFFHHSIKEFVEALTNIFIFLPYFFSVTALLRTLFYPWKNLVIKKRSRGFNLEEWFNTFSFNLISRIIGATMRLSILIFYLLIQIALLVVIPVIFLGYFILLPFLFLLTIMHPDEEEKKALLKKRFIESHLLKQENYQFVEKWFEKIYMEATFRQKWWKLENLLTMPPLGRDWAVGYTPILDEYATDLTHSAYQRQRSNLIGRKKEIAQIEQVLSKNAEANVLIVGEEGVGKHAIIDSFAKMVYEGKTNSLLAYKRILELNMERILNQYTDPKQREQFFEELLIEAKEARSVIILIDNFHRYVSVGINMVDLSHPIEKYGKTADIQFIGITTPAYYERFVYPNTAISRIFTKISVNEVSNTEALTILLDSVERYEQRYQVVIPYETMMTIIEKSAFFITDIPFPEKALQLVDTACAYVVNSLHQKVVTPSEINFVLSQRTHTPTELSPAIKTKLLQMESLLNSRVINQPEATHELSTALRRAFLLLGKRKKPLASFLFLGPTGVGKTETAKALAEYFFGSDSQLIRFDMSLYQTKNDIAQLIGSAESYSPGLLTTAIREHPYGVLLLDEIEKAEKDLLNIFLTVLDEGYFSDPTGKRVDCKNLIIIATSNAGADFIYQNLIQGHHLQINDLITYLVDKKLFTPEFLNRFDGIIGYQPLRLEGIETIAKQMVATICKQIYSLYKVRLNVADQTIQQLAKIGYDPAFGARNLERTLLTQLEDKIAQLILSGQVKEGDEISI